MPKPIIGECDACGKRHRVLDTDFTCDECREPRDLYRRQPSSVFDFAVMDACLRLATDNLIAEIRANRAAGRIPPVARPKCDEQWDHDYEVESGWSVRR